MAEVNGTVTERRKSKSKVSKKYVQEGAGKITEKDIQRVAERADEIEDKFKSEKMLGRYIEDARLLVSMVKDYWNGHYKKIPWYSVAATVFSLLYVMNPFDIIPDFIPFIGWIDDIAVLTIGLNLVEKDLHTYKEWKLNPDATETEDAGYAEEVK